MMTEILTIDGGQKDDLLKKYIHAIVPLNIKYMLLLFLFVL